MQNVLKADIVPLILMIVFFVFPCRYADIVMLSRLATFMVESFLCSNSGSSQFLPIELCLYHVEWQVSSSFSSRNILYALPKRIDVSMIELSKYLSAFFSHSILPFMPSVDEVKVFLTPSFCTLICQRLYFSSHTASFFLIYKSLLFIEQGVCGLIIIAISKMEAGRHFRFRNSYLYLSNCLRIISTYPNSFLSVLNFPEQCYLLFFQHYDRHI